MTNRNAGVTGQNQATTCVVKRENIFIQENEVVSAASEYNT
jgi:hypothetical protein